MRFSKCPVLFRTFPVAPALVGTFGLVTLAGCSSHGEPDPGSYHVSKPEHPAMTAPVSEGRSSPASHVPGHPPMGGRGELPPDHPPIGSRGGTETPTRPIETSGPVSVAGLVFDVPGGWVREAPANALRDAQFRLPGEGGAEDGLVTVSRAGGSIEGNIERWRGQFSGSPPAEVNSREVAGLDAAEVVIEGEYRGMGGASAKEDYRLHAVIIQAPGGQLFVKGTGPSATMERFRESFGELVRSFQKE